MDTNSGAFLGVILTLLLLVLGVISYLVFRKFINKHLVSATIFLVLVYIFDQLSPWNYLFYIASLVCLILVIIFLLKKRKTTPLNK